MKRNLILGVSFLLIMVISACIVYQISPTGTKQTIRVFSGYLICQACACAPHGMAASGVNVLKNPEKHPVSCLKMPSCVASGFGIFINNPNSGYTYYKFDKKGSALAYQNIVCKTVKMDHLLVEVTGKLQNGIIIVNGIEEK